MAHKPGRPADALYVISDLGGGGAQRVLTTLVNGWAARGKVLSVATLAGEDGDFFPLHPAIQRHVVGHTGRSGGTFDAVAVNLRRIIALRRILRDTGAPVAVGFIAPTNVLLVLAAWGLKTRVVISERNDPSRQSFGRLWDRLRRWAYPRADLVTANSAGALESLRQWVPREKTALLPNPLVPPAEDNRAELPGPTILAVGRLHPQKGYDILLEAFARFARQYPRWRLVVLGDGDLRGGLVAHADALGIADRVDWRGQVADPWPFYRAADMFVMASRHEGTPNALLEAMSCGLAPVVSDALPGALEHVCHGDTGLVASSEDPESFAAALTVLAGDDALRNRLGRNARATMGRCEEGPVRLLWEKAMQWR